VRGEGAGEPARCGGNWRRSVHGGTWGAVGAWWPRRQAAVWEREGCSEADGTGAKGEARSRCGEAEAGSPPGALWKHADGDGDRPFGSHRTTRPPAASRCGRGARARWLAGTDGPQTDAAIVAPRSRATPARIAEQTEMETAEGKRRQGLRSRTWCVSRAGPGTGLRRAGACRGRRVTGPARRRPGVRGGDRSVGGVGRVVGALPLILRRSSARRGTGPNVRMGELMAIGTHQTEPTAAGTRLDQAVRAPRGRVAARAARDWGAARMGGRRPRGAGAGPVEGPSRRGGERPRGETRHSGVSERAGRRAREVGPISARGPLSSSSWKRRGAGPACSDLGFSGGEVRASGREGGAAGRARVGGGGGGRTGRGVCRHRLREDGKGSSGPSHGGRGAGGGWSCSCLSHFVRSYGWWLLGGGGRGWNASGGACA